MSSPINSLPPELLTQVMSSLDTSRDLLNFVTTSKHLHQTFQYSRTVVLGAVIKNALPPELINLSIAACESADISKSWYAQPDIEAIAKQQLDFQERHQRGRTTATLHDYDRLLSLYKLWSLLDYFLYLFEAKSWTVACRKLQPKQIASRRLSEGERTRLQRAFLTYELYRRITPAHHQHSNRHEASNQTKNFFKVYRSWEREEILSVEEFLVEVAKDVLRSARGYTYQQISCLARDLVAQPGTVLDETPLQKIKTFMDLTGYDVFWLDWPANARSLHYFAARGLPFMKWLSELSPSDQLHIVAKLKTKRCNPSILEALYREPDRSVSDDLERGESDDLERSESDHKPALDDPNSSWQWAESHGLTAGKSKLLFRYELRSMGYCFWDGERMNDYWDCSEDFETSLQKLKLVPRSRNDDGVLWKDQEPESAFHAMFKDVQIPKDVFDRSTTLFEDRLNEGRVFVFDDNETDPYLAPFSEREAEMFGFEY